MRNRRRAGGRASSRSGAGQRLGESLGCASRHSRLGNACGPRRTARSSSSREGTRGASGGSRPRRCASCSTCSCRRTGACRRKCSAGSTGTAPGSWRRSSLAARLQPRPPRAMLPKCDAVKEGKYPASPPLRGKSPQSHQPTRAATRLGRVPAACRWDRPPVPRGPPT